MYSTGRQGLGIGPRVRALFFLGAAIALAGCGAAPGYEEEPCSLSEHHAPAERPGAWTQSPDDPATPFAMGQKWIGTYVCAQGETEVVLHIAEVDGANVRALFEFDHPPSGASGLFEMQGAWSVNRRTMELSPVRWIRQPPHYVMVGMEGTVSVGGKRFVGLVDGPGCSHFSLRLAR